MASRPHRHSDNLGRCLYDDASGNTRCAYEEFRKPSGFSRVARHLLWKNAASGRWETFCGARASLRRDAARGSEATCAKCGALPKPRGLR